MATIARKKRTNKKSAKRATKPADRRLLEQAKAEDREGGAGSPPLLRALPGQQKNVTLSAEDARDWAEWLAIHQQDLMAIVVATEELISEANAVCRFWNKQAGYDDNVHERYDEIEEKRNTILKRVCNIASAEKVIETGFRDALRAHANAEVQP